MSADDKAKLLALFDALADAPRAAIPNVQLHETDGSVGETLMTWAGSRCLEVRYMNFRGDTTGQHYSNLMCGSISVIRVVEVEEPMWSPAQGVAR